MVKEGFGIKQLTSDICEGRMRLDTIHHMALLLGRVDICAGINWEKTLKKFVKAIGMFGRHVQVLCFGPFPHPGDDVDMCIKLKDAHNTARIIFQGSIWSIWQAKKVKG